MSARLAAMAKLAGASGSKKVVEKRGHSSGPGERSKSTVGRGESSSRPSAPATKPTGGRSQAPSPSSKRKDTVRTSPPRPKRIHLMDKGKSIARHDSPSAGRTGRAGFFDLPAMPDPRPLGVPNSHGVLDEASSDLTWRAFQSILFEKDQSAINRKRIPDVMRSCAYHMMAAASYAFNIGERADTYWRESRELFSENKRLSAAAEQSRITDLEAQLASAHSRIQELEKGLADSQEQTKKLDSDLLASIERESALQRRVTQLQVEVEEAYKRGKVDGRTEREAEFERQRPSLELAIARDFLHSPVFNMANVMLGVNDLVEGWKRAIGQIRFIGGQFDETKLNMLLDSNMQPPPEDEDEFDLDVEGHKFQPLLQDVEEMVQKMKRKSGVEIVELEDAGAVDESATVPGPDAVEAGALGTTEGNEAVRGDPGSAEMIEALRGDAAEEG